MLRWTGNKIVRLWKQRRYLAALLLVLLVLLLALPVLYVVNPNALTRALHLVGKAAIWVAEHTGELKPNVERPKSPPVAPGPARAIYLALSRAGGQSGQTVRIVAHRDDIVSIEWKFAAYVVRLWEKSGDGPWRQTGTVPMSQLLGGGRKFRFGGLVLVKEPPTGVLSASKFFYQDFKPSRLEWLETKFVLERGGTCIGTIYSAPFLPNFWGELYGGFIGKMIDAIPLSLEDESFESVSLQSLSSGGVVSLTGIFGPFFGPMLEVALPPDRTRVFAFRLGGPNSVEYLGQAKPNPK